MSIVTVAALTLMLLLNVPHLISQMMFCCIDVQRIIKIQQVLQRMWKKEHVPVIRKRVHNNNGKKQILCCSSADFFQILSFL